MGESISNRIQDPWPPPPTPRNRPADTTKTTTWATGAKARTCQRCVDPIAPLAFTVFPKFEKCHQRSPSVNPANVIKIWPTANWQRLQVKPQWIAVQRLLSARTLPGVKWVICTPLTTFTDYNTQPPECIYMQFHLSKQHDPEPKVCQRTVDMGDCSA